MAGKKERSSSLFIAILAYIPGILLLLYKPISGVSPGTADIVAACVFIYLGSLALYDPAKKSSNTVMKITFSLFFALYLIMIINFTLFDGFFGRHAAFPSLSDFSEIKEYAAARSNFIPLHTVGNIIKGYMAGTVSQRFFITNICGNLAAFAPLAFFMPVLFRTMRRFFSFLAFTGIFVIIIELSQILLMTGSADIDDFLLNVTGTCLLYGILHIKHVKKLIFSITKQKI